MEDKEKLKILILSWRGPKHPNAGGAETSTHEHAKGWVRAGHSVTLFTSDYKGAKKQEAIDGVSIIRSGSQVLGVQIAVLKWYLFAAHPKFDLVIDQFHGIPFFTPFFVRVKKMAFIHEVTKEIWKFNPWPKPWYFIPALLGSLLEPLIFRFLYQNIPFMTVSESTKKDLISWGISDGNITVIHNGITIPKLKIPEKENKKTLIYLGSLSKDKGIEDALKVFSLLKNKDFRFWVAGKSDPGYLKFLKTKSQKLDIGKRVKFFGFVSEIRKFELLAKAHLLINPSVREGWGLVVIEAARMGTPSVAYNVAGLKDSVINNKTGILCNNMTHANLVEEILKLLEDEEKLQEMSKQAIAWSKKFRWHESVAKSLKLIDKV
ncbi:TPA: hypothetical protein DEP06_05330 [Candidatus Daviesbacteria bacterium]|nr:hypothetical protein [Candidatus Daviesbacteria bacterium]